MEIVVRAVVIFVFIFLLTRLMGKKELSALSPFELILLVTIGDLVQQGVTQEDMSLTGAMLAAGTIGLLIVALSYVTYRWPSSRSVLEGLPVVVVKDGRVLDEALRVERLRREDLEESARQQGIASIADVRLGVLEPDGKFAFVRFDEEPPPPERERRY